MRTRQHTRPVYEESCPQNRSLGAAVNPGAPAILCHRRPIVTRGSPSLAIVAAVPSEPHHQVPLRCSLSDHGTSGGAELYAKLDVNRVGLQHLVAERTQGC